MRQNKKEKNRSAIAIMLCFCLMALVSIFAVKATVDKLKSNMESATGVAKKQAVGQTEETEPEIVDSIDNEVEQTPTSPSDFISPVEGEIIMNYSIDMPIYWKTLDQYMTHCGVDIASPLGTPVQACASGTVTKIENDDTMGVTVEINHGNNLISIYSNLANDGLIELGEVVTQGTVIGKVGDSALFEFDSPHHLHFEMKKGNKHIDPTNYIK